jgi:hypothetical protein
MPQPQCWVAISKFFHQIHLSIIFKLSPMYSLRAWTKCGQVLCQNATQMAFSPVPSTVVISIWKLLGTGFTVYIPIGLLVWAPSRTAHQALTAFQAFSSLLFQTFPHTNSSLWTTWSGIVIATTSLLVAIFCDSQLFITVTKHLR